MHLATGSTLLCKSITVGTIKDNIAAAASFLIYGKPCRRLLHGFIDRQATSCPELRAVYKELERWEKDPTRREPLTLEMLPTLHVQVQASNDTNKDSPLHFFEDWLTVSLSSSFSKI